MWQAARKGEDAVIASALASDDEAVQASLIKGSPSDEEQRSPAHLAAEFGHTNCLRLLLPLVGKVKDRAGRSPLHAAASGVRPEETIALLLDEGGGANALGGLDAACGEHGRTTMHHASFAGSVPAVQLLLKRTPGAAAVAKLLRKTDKKGRTAISLAASRGHENVVAAILNAVVTASSSSSSRGVGGGGDDDDNAAAAAAAAARTALEASGASALCGEGLAAVHHAARGGHAGVVAAMMKACGAAGKEAGEVRDKKGRTALHAAAMEGQLHVQKLLEDAGCDASAADKDGQTPAQLGAASMGRGGEGGRNSFMNM